MPCGVQSFSERDKKVFNTKTNIVQWCRRLVKERKNNSKDPQWEMWLSCKQTTSQSLLRKSHHWTHWMNEGILITSWLHKRAENGLLAKILCTRSHLPAMKRRWCEILVHGGQGKVSANSSSFYQNHTQGTHLPMCKECKEFLPWITTFFFFFFLTDNSVWYTKKCHWRKDCPDFFLTSTLFGGWLYSALYSSWDEESLH